MKQTSPAPMRHTISVLIENSFGVLTRVAGLFSGRGFNIDTLNVGPTHRENTSHLTSFEQCRLINSYEASTRPSI
jgi:acetolactate synthase small subunit